METQVILWQQIPPVVGESFRQDVIRKLFEQVGRKPFLAILKRDPENEYDPNAVQVLGPDGEQIGFLSREAAEEQNEEIEEIEEEGGCPCSAWAVIAGGVGHKEHFGIFFVGNDESRELTRAMLESQK